MHSIVFLFITCYHISMKCFLISLLTIFSICDSSTYSHKILDTDYTESIDSVKQKKQVILTFDSDYAEDHKQRVIKDIFKVDKITRHNVNSIKDTYDIPFIQSSMIPSGTAEAIFITQLWYGQNALLVIAMLIEALLIMNCVTNTAFLFLAGINALCTGASILARSYMKKTLYIDKKINKNNIHITVRTNHHYLRNMLLTILSHICIIAAIFIPLLPAILSRNTEE